MSVRVASDEVVDGIRRVGLDRRDSGAGFTVFRREELRFIADFDALVRFEVFDVHTGRTLGIVA